MVKVQQMIVSFRCPLEMVESWMAFNTPAPAAVIVKKVNNNGSEATIEISGFPEAVVEVGNVAGVFGVQMYDLKAKFL